MSALRDALQDLPDAIYADLLESETENLIVVDVPGATSESTDVSLEDDRIRVEARREKPVPPDFRYLTEDRSLFIDFEVPLPPESVPQDAEATVERGVLEIRIPKPSGEGTTVEVQDETE